MALHYFQNIYEKVYEKYINIIFRRHCWAPEFCSKSGIFHIVSTNVHMHQLLSTVSCPVQHKLYPVNHLCMGTQFESRTVKVDFTSGNEKYYIQTVNTVNDYC